MHFSLWNSLHVPDVVRSPLLGTGEETGWEGIALGLGGGLIRLTALL